MVVVVVAGALVVDDVGTESDGEDEAGGMTPLMFGISITSI